MQNINSDNNYAREHGVPKAFRQYAKRYGGGIVHLVKMHKQIPADMLDHWADKIRAAHKALAMMQGR